MKDDSHSIYQIKLLNPLNQKTYLISFELFLFDKKLFEDFFEDILSSCCFKSATRKNMTVFPSEERKMSFLNRKF